MLQLHELRVWIRACVVSKSAVDRSTQNVVLLQTHCIVKQNTKHKIKNVNKNGSCRCDAHAKQVRNFDVMIISFTYKTIRIQNVQFLFSTFSKNIRRSKSVCKGKNWKIKLFPFLLYQQSSGRVFFLQTTEEKERWKNYFSFLSFSLVIPLFHCYCSFSCLTRL